MRDLHTTRITFAAALLAAGALAALGATPARAQTGVSNDRVSLPEGPGSLEGIGDDVGIDPNMGSMSYSVPIDIPAGFPGLTPDVGLSYSSAAGSGVVGMGWSMPEPSVERLTLRGVPEYDADDEFEVDRGEQLVRTEVDGDTQVYRARCEQGWVRYTWRDVDDGSEGYFVAERPDGVMCSYGADQDGTLVATARVGGERGTFRYLPVDCWDEYGHRLHYQYGTYGTTSLVEHIGYVFTEGDDDPDYEIEFTYDGRQDAVINASGGFEETLADRLVEITVTARGTQRARYELSYESYGTSGGFSRLANVQRYGVADEQYPVSFSFGYTETLGTICDGVDCEEPFTVDMGSVGVNLQSGAAALVDINGDGLPDLIDSAQVGQPHNIHINTFTLDQHTWGAAYESGANLGDQNGHDFTEAHVQPLDVNGDGFTDVVNAKTGEVLINRGTGDWDEVLALFADNSLSTASDDLLESLHFLDYNNDRYIDIVRTSGAEGNTFIYANTGEDFVVDDGVENIGAGFDSDTLELNDINGDGLLDAVQVQQTSVRYRLNLGWGRWSDEGEDDEWREITSADLDLNETQRVSAEMEDMNGDAMADLVLVEGTSVRIWINRNGETFDPEQTLTAGGSLDFPERLSTTTVLFADMNGNGSSDVVWITQTGETTFLELYPVRPNLLARIENGLGMVIDVSYGTTVEHMARDGGPGAWDYRIPFPMIVVDQLDEWDRLTNVHQIVEYAYHNGFYDGVEKQFRGYEEVTETTLGDASIADGAVDYVYDVGVTNPCRAGLLLELDQTSDGEVLFAQTDTYENCDVAEVDQSGLLFEVQHICQTATEVEVREGASGGEWVTQRQTWEHDGYGQETRHVDHGVTAIGGSETCGTCERADGEYGAACGAGCLGDERITLTDYVIPGADTGGRWLLGLESRQRTYADEDSERYQEVRTYYDGPDYVGLDEGEATLGFISRITQRVDADDSVITPLRALPDEHGNSVVEIGPLGEIGGDAHIRRFEMTDDGLRVAVSEMLIGDRGEGDDVLRRTYGYDPVWDKVSTVRQWTLYRDGTAMHDPLTQGYGYDNFGRLVFEMVPGDSAELPTTVHEWHLSTPVSSVTTRRRGVAGGDFDIESVECIDGRGRSYQTRQMLAEGDWLVSGFEVYNLNGNEREVFQPYRADSGECDTEAPDSVLSTRFRYDALGRVLEIFEPDGEREAIEYGPMRQTLFDENDLDEDSPLYDTPTIRVNDGLEREVATGRTTTDGEIEWFTYTYDDTGGLARLTDPMGNERTQTFDLLSQVISVDDPDRGVTTFAYDAAGDIVEETNAQGETIIYEYDGAGRLVRAFDEDAPSETYFELTYDFDSECGSFCTYGTGSAVAVRFPTPEGDGVEWRQYDSRGNQTGLRRQIGDVVMDRTMVYDNAGRLVSQTFPGGRTLEYEFDASGYVTAIPGFIDAVVYDDRGDVSRVELANGVVNEVYSDDRRRLLRYAITDGGGTPIIERALTLDAAGLLLEMDDLAPLDGVPDASAAFTYDGFERLLSATFGDDDETVSYAYDAADNIVARTSTLGDDSPVHDGDRVIDADRPHQVTRAGAFTYAYDAAGRMTRRGDVELTWDAMDRHVTSLVDGEVTVEHAYIDQDSRAMTRTGSSTVYYHGDDFEIVDGVATFVLGLGGTSVARMEYADFAAEMLSDVAPAEDGDTLSAVGDDEINAADAWLSLATELELLSLDTEPSAVNDLLASSAALGLIGWDERKTFLHRDHLDSIVAVTDADGEIVERRLVYPFGATRWSSTNAPEPSSFTDKRTDPGSDLILIGLREYDPHLGRWIAPDVAFATIGVSELEVPWEAMGNYVYALNSPINVQDEDGARGIAKWLFGAGFGFAGGILGGALGFIAAGPPGAVAGAIGGAIFFGAQGFAGGWLAQRGAPEANVPARGLPAPPPYDDDAAEVAYRVVGPNNVVMDSNMQNDVLMGDAPAVTAGAGEGERDRGPTVYVPEGDGAGDNDIAVQSVEQGDNLAEILEEERMFEPSVELQLGGDTAGGVGEAFGDALANAAADEDAILDDIVNHIGTAGAGGEGGGGGAGGGLPLLGPGEQDSIADGN